MFNFCYQISIFLLYSYYLIVIMFLSLRFSLKTIECIIVINKIILKHKREIYEFKLFLKQYEMK